MACEKEITGAGYVPANERAGALEPEPDAAVCDACGFNEIGMMGCAPELADVIDPRPDHVLLYVRSATEGYDVVQKKR